MNSVVSSCAGIWKVSLNPQDPYQQPSRIVRILSVAAAAFGLLGAVICGLAWQLLDTYRVRKAQDEFAVWQFLGAETVPIDAMTYLATHRSAAKHLRSQISSADLNKVDEQGRNLLDYCMTKRNPEVFKLLSENHTLPQEWMAKCWERAAECWEKTEDYTWAYLLKEFGVDINAKKQGRTALETCLAQKKYSQVRFLLSFGANRPSHNHDIPEHMKATFEQAEAAHQQNETGPIILNFKKLLTDKELIKHTLKGILIVTLCAGIAIAIFANAFKVMASSKMGAALGAALGLVSCFVSGMGASIYAISSYSNKLNEVAKRSFKDMFPDGLALYYMTTQPALITELIRERANLNKISLGGSSLWYFACINKRFETFKLLAGEFIKLPLKQREGYILKVLCSAPSSFFEYLCNQVFLTSQSPSETFDDRTLRLMWCFVQDSKSAKVLNRIYNVNENSLMLFMLNTCPDLITLDKVKAWLHVGVDVDKEEDLDDGRRMSARQFVLQPDVTVDPEIKALILNAYNPNQKR